MTIAIKQDFRRKYKPSRIKARIELSKLDDSRFFWRGKKIFATVELIPSGKSNNDYFIIQKNEEDELKSRSVGVGYIQELEGEKPEYRILSNDVKDARDLLFQANQLIGEIEYNESARQLEEEINNYLERTK